MSRITIILTVCLLLAACSSKISKACTEAFHARSGKFTVTVYPVHVLQPGEEPQPEIPLAQIIVDTLNERGIAVATLAATDVTVPFKFVMGQDKMWKVSGNLFATEIASANINTDYALLVEVLIPPGAGEVWGVHVYLANSMGTLCEGGLTNSHHEIFTAVEPRDRSDGVKIALAMLHCLDPIANGIDRPSMYTPSF